MILDPDNDELLLAQARNKVAEASEGILDPEHPTIDSILKAQVFLQAEFAWYLNLLPQATAIEVLALLSETSRSPGTYATGTITLQKASPRLSSTQIPQGTLVSVQGKSYVTTQAAEIPGGSVSVDVPITALEMGTQGNAKAFALTSVSPGIPGVDTCYNSQPITGGSDLEELEDYITRAKAALWSNGAIISVYDFQREAESLLGAESRAVVVPMLNRAKTDLEGSNVHLFLFDSTGVPVSSGTALQVANTLEPRVFAGCRLHVSPGEYKNVLVQVVARVPVASREMATSIYQGLESVYSYRVASPGGSLIIRQLMRAAWVEGVTEIVSVTIDGGDYDTPMPNEWTLGHLDTVEITLVDPYGYSDKWYFGASEALNDPD